MKELNEIAKKRDQTLAQMALAWILKDSRITSVILGASKPKQVTDAASAINDYHFSNDELNTIELTLNR